MKIKNVIDALNALNLPEAECILALPGNRFSALTLVEQFSKDDAGRVSVVAILYPHPRDVSGPSAAPAGGRPEWAQAIDSVFDFLSGGKEGEGGTNE
jgi:hypothetical protein